MQVHQPMVFWPVEAGTPEEGKFVLVQLRDRTFRFGMVLQGRFANYEPHADEFVTFAFADRIAFWAEIVPPLSKFTSEDCDQPTIEEAAMAAGAEAPDRAEDVYA